MVVLHPNQESYLAAAGQGAIRTAGSSAVDRLQGRISARRIDLRGDRDDYLTAALPHELTHVILADHFSNNMLPRWADEGMAMLADPESKRERHARDLRTACDTQTTFQMSQFLPLDDYPTADRWPAFYGQSLAVVTYLVGRGSPSQFVKFLDAARDRGYNEALQKVYNIRDMQELDRLWLASVVNGASSLLAKNP